MTFSAEEVRAQANYEGRATGDQRTYEMLTDYAAILEQREAVTPGIDNIAALVNLWRQEEHSDEPETEFDKGCEQTYRECADSLESYAYRHARQVPIELDEGSSVNINRPNTYAAGWNDCRSALLAAAPPAPSEEVDMGAVKTLLELVEDEHGGDHTEADCRYCVAVNKLTIAIGDKP